MSKTAKKFQILIKDERDETCNEMYRDTILQLEVYGPRPEHALHNAEVFLHLPSALVCLYDGFCSVFRTRTYSIKTVILFLLCDGIPVSVINGTFCRFLIFSGMVHLDEALKTRLT
jgi:hypothetical protein